MSEDRTTVADIECLDCNTNMSLEIPSELVDDIGIAETLSRIESSECFICNGNNRRLVS